MTAIFEPRVRYIKRALRANAPLELGGVLFADFESMSRYIQTVDYLHEAIGITEAVEGWSEYRVDWCEHFYDEKRGVSIRVHISGVWDEGDADTAVEYPFDAASGEAIVGLNGL